jgi:hypothetical protein
LDGAKKREGRRERSVLQRGHQSINAKNTKQGNITPLKKKLIIEQPGKS